MSIPLGPRPPAQRSELRAGLKLAAQILAGLLGGHALLIWGFGVVMVVLSVTGDVRSDPHGYGIAFGLLLTFPFGLIAVVLLPFAWPRWRGRCYVFLTAMACYVVSQGLLMLALDAAS